MDIQNQNQNPTTFLPNLSRLSTQSTLQITSTLTQLRSLYWPPSPAPLPASLTLPQRSIKNLIHDTSVPDSGYASAEEDEDEPEGPRDTYITHVASPSDQDDDGELDILRADPLERAFAIRWLTGFICRSDVWVEACSSDEDGGEYEARSRLLDEASSLLAAFTSDDTEDGGEEDEAIVRKFEFARSDGRPICVELNDAPLLDNDHTSVGLQSWGSAIRFGEQMCVSPEAFSLKCAEQPLRILELGAGTGLLSIVAAKLLQGGDEPPPTIVATDYHPDVLANLEANVERNFPTRPSSSHSSSASAKCPITVHPLDWSSPSFTPPFNSGFDLILAADCIYEPDHAQWIRNCVEKLLKDGGVFWMIMALRPSGRHDGLERTVMEGFFARTGLEEKEEKGGNGERRLEIKEMREEEKMDGVGRADEAGYRIFRIEWGK